MPVREILLEDDPLWYKDAILYELHIKAFFDSNGDGIGDFKGLTRKLDYLQDLGVTAIWLLPFYPSPQRDDGYDIADYFDIHPDYGTMKDFKEFLREAHSRGLRVITELVLNHTSDQHPWFQKARRAKPNSAARNFYVWSDTPDRYKDARIIFKDFEASNWTWDNVAKAHFWHRFYSHQPDLNYDNPQVHKATFRVIDYWMNLGVDGVRIDAVPYLYEREGTNCENLPETYDYLKQLRGHLDGKFKNRMLLAEANQWPEDAVAYFGDGDMCHMAFHFPIMPRMFMALEMEDSFPILDILDQTPSIAETCQWALFLRNHDELTLEMVTDEERDYMYQMYAKDRRARINLGIRRRLAPLLENDRRKFTLMYTLLFTLPGTPVIYYGDELGMGDNYHLGDRDGVRTPMQWSLDRNAGFSRANPQHLYLPVIVDSDYHYATVSVETQERNRSSLLWWMKRFISLRKHFKAFGRGSIEILQPDNRKIFAFLREYEDEKILVAVNLSRHAQMTRFQLPKFKGYIPEEIFSRNRFIPIREEPYALTFGPFDWYVFQLQEGGGKDQRQLHEGECELKVTEMWSRVFEGKERERLEEELLPSYLQTCRWFGGKARQMQELKILDSIPVNKQESLTQILILRVEYTEGLPDMYSLPLTFTGGDEAASVVQENPQAIVCRLLVDQSEGILYDAMYSEKFCQDLLSLIARRRKIKSPLGVLVGYPAEEQGKTIRRAERELKPKVLKAEQSNTSVLFGNDFFLKIYRHPDEGVNPDLEISRFLTEKAKFPNIPPFAGGIEYRRQGEAEPIGLAILQRFVPNQGEGLSLYLGLLHRYYNEVLGKRGDLDVFPEVSASLFDISIEAIPPELQALFSGQSLELTELLGKRTAELHLALFADKEDPNFAPEPFSTLWQRSVFQSMQSLSKKVLQLLKSNFQRLPEGAQQEAAEILEFKKEIVDRQRAILQKKLSAMKIRIHGDYHLGQVLYTGKDFIIIDFEGEPARTLGERRIKASPLRDVAGMIRSFHYAAYLALLKESPIRTEDRSFLEPWSELWTKIMAGILLRSYLDVIREAKGLVPKDRTELDIMLKAYLLDKAVYELGYELNNRPDWVMIPVRGIKQLLKSV